MLTVKQALNKWCPLGRMLAFTPIPGVDPATGPFAPNVANRTADALRGTCVADQCMMWRWSESFCTRVEMATANIVARRDMESRVMVLDNSKLEPVEEEKQKTKPISGLWKRAETFYDPESGQWKTAWETEAPLNRKGYCGLSGKMEE